MSRFARAVVAALGVVVLASIVALVPQKNVSGAGGAPVVVQNTPLPVSVTNTPVPVSVSGGVNVNNFPAVQSVSGTVTLNGTSSVQVANTTANPVLNRNIDRPENQPFNTVLCTNGAIDQIQPQPCFFGDETSPRAFTVPSTTYNSQTVQRLAIEYVSGACNTLPSAPSSVTAVGLAAGSTLNTVNGPGVHFFPLTLGNGGSISTVTWAEPVRVYGDPGQSVSFGVITSGPIVGCTMYVSGYLTTM